jgi:hypothetical protein
MFVTIRTISVFSCGQEGNMVILDFRTESTILLPKKTSSVGALHQ